MDDEHFGTAQSELGGVSPPQEPEDVANRRWRGFWFGMKLHLMIAIPVILILAVVHRDLLVMAVATFCLWQWLYLVPTIMIEHLHGRPKRAIGVATAGLVTMALGTLLFFISVAVLCFGLFPQR
jgi:hypothetical protein